MGKFETKKNLYTQIAVSRKVVEEHQMLLEFQFLYQI